MPKQARFWMPTQKNERSRRKVKKAMGCGQETDPVTDPTSCCGNLIPGITWSTQPACEPSWHRVAVWLVCITEWFDSVGTYLPVKWHLNGTGFQLITLVSILCLQRKVKISSENLIFFSRPFPSHHQFFSCLLVNYNPVSHGSSSIIKWAVFIRWCAKGHPVCKSAARRTVNSEHNTLMRYCNTLENM